jgi:hypothetical protein
MYKRYLGCARSRYVENQRRIKELEKKKSEAKQKKHNSRKSLNSMIKKLKLDEGFDLWCKVHQRWYTKKGKLTPCKEDSHCVLCLRQREPVTQINLF